MSPMILHSLVLVGLSLFPLLVLFLSTKLAFSRAGRRLPSPPKLPVIGNLHQLGSLPHVSLHALSKKHGPLMLLRLGQVPALVVSSAEMAKEIMKTHDLVFAGRPSLKATSILLRERDLAFTPYGDYWRQVRKLCTVHLLSARKVQSFEAMREEEVAALIGKISQASGQQVNMSEILNAFANDVICRAVSGKFFREEGKKKLFCDMIEENSALVGAFHIEDYFPSLAWLRLSFGLRRRAQRNSDRWHALLDEMIEVHGDNMKDEGQEDDFVHVLLSLQKDDDMEFALTRQQIKALLMDMFTAETDTSYIVLEWAMAELLRNPEAMEKLQAEVRNTTNGEGMVQQEDLIDMSYLKAVLKEVLRLHPPGPLLLPRESREDCQVKDYPVPCGTRVIINAWAIGRDPQSWEAPEEFQPERFLNSPVDFRGNDFQFIPFGAGRRVCPGMNFAVSTTELALANLVHQFDWKLPDGMTTEELDMAEAPGLGIRRKQSLHLVPNRVG